MATANALIHAPGRTVDTTSDITHDVEETFLRAEQSGLKLAIIGRTVVLVLLGVWLVGSRSADPTRALNFALLVAVFVSLGLIHYFLIATRFDKYWIKYVFVTMDIVIVSTLVATQPLYATADLPSVMLFRSSIFPFYFVILGVAAFSFSPGLVLWAGTAGAIGWLGAFFHSASSLTKVLNWGDVPPRPHSRAGDSSRARSLLRCPRKSLAGGHFTRRGRLSDSGRHVAGAEYTQATIGSGTGPRYHHRHLRAVCAANHCRCDDWRNAAPWRRSNAEATILFADIAGFTHMTERAGPCENGRNSQRLFRRSHADYRHPQRCCHPISGRCRACYFQCAYRRRAPCSQRFRGGAGNAGLRRDARVRR